MRIVTTIAALAMVATTSAQVAAAPEPCLQPAEVETLTTALLPDLLQAVATRCAPALPQGATLSTGLAPLMQRYRAAGQAAEPAAATVLGKLMAKELKDEPADTAFPLVKAVIATEVGKDLKLADCPTYDRAIGPVSPLPPQNLAALFAMLLELGGGRKSPFTICPARPKQ